MSATLSTRRRSQSALVLQRDRQKSWPQTLSEASKMYQALANMVKSAYPREGVVSMLYILQRKHLRARSETIWGSARPRRSKGIDQGLNRKGLGNLSEI